MQKWEYLTFSISNFRVCLVNEKDVRSRDAKGKIAQGQLLSDYLRDIGEEGWEVVGTTGFDSYIDGLWTMIAKRPKAL